MYLIMPSSEQTHQTLLCPSHDLRLRFNWQETNACFYIQFHFTSLFTLPVTASVASHLQGPLIAALCSPGPFKWSFSVSWSSFSTHSASTTHLPNLVSSPSASRSPSRCHHALGPRTNSETFTSDCILLHQFPRTALLIFHRTCKLLHIKLF